MLWVAIIGLVMTVAAVAVAGRRVGFLYKLATSGPPAPERVAYAKEHAADELKAQLVEVFGQKKLLKWTPSGTAHFFVMWAFFILLTVYIEAYGAIIQGAITGEPDFHIPLIGTWGVLGFLQDFIAVACLLGLVAFAVIRMKNSPKTLGRKSRFSGSHLGGAWLVLFMIFNIIWTLFLARGASAANGNFPYSSGAFASLALGDVLPASPLLEEIALILHIGFMLVFLVIVVNSKHLHIFTAPLNVLFSRRPDGLGAAPEMRVDGKVVDFEDEDLDPERLGRGKIGDTTWKGFLDFYSCTECGRCQSQCPAWNTDKPLSPKMLILDQRDHAFKVAPYLMAASTEHADTDVLALLEKPLVGEDGVIHPDVLWSCTNCGACVEQCPVDIEHIDHILDMRRYQVMVESSFPSEAGVMVKNLENKGNPWGMSEMKRADWIEELDFEVELIDEKMPEDTEYLFWVGCAGALEDRAKKTTKAVAELLHIAGVKFAVLGPMEACTGDPARRLGM
ncbi:MAG: (Fe-S)-binding protein, partial [Nonomuraea sp.]|nr:(Fe-S)-binding protein [Nonomuraea sp.]